MSRFCAAGVPYRSLDILRTPHYRTREPFVEISQANVGLIRRDLLDQADGPRDSGWVRFAKVVRHLYPRSRSVSRVHAAAGGFAAVARRLRAASVRDYRATARDGRRNMHKIGTVLAEMETVVNGLTRNLDLSVLTAAMPAT